MVQGIGTDLLAVERIGRSLNDEKFINAVYTHAEQEAAKHSKNEQYFYSTRFAGKEAVFKSLGIDPDKVRLSDIEILHDEFDAPIVTLRGCVREFAEERGIREVKISLSWEKEYALAFAIAQ